MTEGADLLAAILANPACDTTRLVYADWLEENGGRSEAAIAARIRRQIARGKEFKINGLRGFPHDVDSSSFLITWRRGFVDSIRCSAGWWLQHGDNILCQHPAVKRVTLTKMPELQYDTCHIEECMGEMYPGIDFKLASRTS